MKLYQFFWNIIYWLNFEEIILGKNYYTSNRNLDIIRKTGNNIFSNFLWPIWDQKACEQLKWSVQKIFFVFMMIIDFLFIYSFFLLKIYETKVRARMRWLLVQPNNLIDFFFLNFLEYTRGIEIFLWSIIFSHAHLWENILSNPWLQKSIS